MLTKEKIEVLEFYNLGLASYKQRKWDDAMKAFETALKIDPHDGPSALYLRRAKNYKDTPPPENWDGVFIMTTK